MSLRESLHTTHVLKDSRSSLQAAARLARGEFSASAGVAAFLSTISRYRVVLQHISGSSNAGKLFVAPPHGVRWRQVCTSTVRCAPSRMISPQQKPCISQCQLSWDGVVPCPSPILSRGATVRRSVPIYAALLPTSSRERVLLGKPAACPL